MIFMSELFFEKINKASRDYPYLDFERENLTYVFHFHEEIEIIKVLSGIINVICDNRKITAEEGDICFFLPGEIHSFHSNESLSSVIKLNCKNLIENIDFHSLKATDNLLKKEDSLNLLIDGFLEEIKKEDSDRKKGFGYAVNSISNKIVCEMLRSGRLIKSDSEYKKRHVFYISVFEKVSEFTENNYKEKVSLEDAAKSCNLSKYYFSHIFKEVTGMGFIEFLTAYRVERAAEELKHTDRKVTDIAFNCGFASLRSLNRTFKSRYGVNPLTYRKMFFKD